ncbi:uncharacterized protein KD926_004886 [Aspergillus affinis]|uniref:uncharacterized protein n=1 Tax=Aspergillus affinis TaxID=1070780 RepID=UPI0022FE3A91|nr:uncharacterized protein KD926_004886 [Aspergillus affinis]KAI9042821.1 hypothetical protein KD926_004886 [Aspergillus affinis]
MPTERFKSMGGIREFAYKQIDTFQSGRSHNQFIRVTDVPEAIWLKLDEYKLGGRRSYDFKTHELDTRPTLSRGHERAAQVFQLDLMMKMGAMGVLEQDLDPVGSTTYLGDSRTKEADAAIAPYPPVNIVIIIRLDRQPRTIELEVWKMLETPTDPEIALSVELTPMGNSVIYRASCDLRLSFRDIMPREPPAGGEEVVFSTLELEDWAQRIFKRINEWADKAAKTACKHPSVPAPNLAPPLRRQAKELAHKE